jgi:peptidylprolyl isomerase
MVARASLLLLALLTPGCGLLGRSRSVPVERAEHTTPSGVVWVDLLAGTGPVAEAGDALTIEYVARLADGTRVDATSDRGVPFTFRLGAAPVPGWNEGLLGMRAGGKRRLEVPADLAYGAAGIPGLVPPDSPMVFEVELLGIAP